MSIALYMDEQVLRQITAGLRLRGVDVLAVQEDERIGTPDVQNVNNSKLPVNQKLP